MSKKCFFLGHRDSSSSIKPLLKEVIEKHIVEHGVTEFFVGNHGTFDAMSCSVLAEAKKMNPEIRNYLVLAYHPSIKLFDLPKGFDGSVFPEGQEYCPYKVAIPRLNRKMIHDCDFLIAHVQKITGGSYKLMQYAVSRAKRGMLTITNPTTAQNC